MSPLRRTSTSPSGDAISPLGVMLCVLATLVTVPLVLASTASSDSVEIAAVVVDDTVSNSELDAEIEIDGLFAAGARVSEVPAAPTPSPDPVGAAHALSAASDASTVGTPADMVESEPQRAVVDESPAATTSSSDDSDDAAPSDAAEPSAATPQRPVTTSPPATTEPAPSTTAAPEPTTPPTTAAPESAAPAEEAVAATPADPEPDSVQAAPGAPTAEQWAALRQCEASGSYTITSSNGLYHGAYQFYQPTWDGLAKQAGRTDLVGLPPSQASPADQDALALLLWQQRGNQPWPHCGVHLPTGP